MIHLNDNEKLSITRGVKPKERVSEIIIAKGKSKYLRLSSLFVEKYSLKNKKSVDIFIQDESRKSLVIFRFRDDDKGILTFSVNNDNGIGYISGASLFKRLNVDNNKLSIRNFVPREDTDGKSKLYIIEISKG